MGFKVGIIGAGIAGIAASIRLAVRGHQVTVFEANDYPGGKLTEIQLGDYRFDAGPSLFTLPELVDELFTLAGESPQHAFQYSQLEEVCHYFFEDGEQIITYNDLNKCFSQFDRFENGSKEARDALNKSATLYKFLGEMFMFRSLHDPATYFSKPAWRAYANLHKMDFFRTMNQANGKAFTDSRLTQLFNRYATYNGSDPYQTPATLNIIPHLEFGKGAYFPTKGMHDITQSLERLATRVGVRFEYGQAVDRILLEGKKVKGLKVDGQAIRFDRVVSNMDVVGTYRKLLPEVSAPHKILKQQKSSSALIFYWGLKSQTANLGLHNILFSEDYRTEFEHIFKQKTVFDDPTVYINITSKFKSDDAPVGGENWFVMINVPHNEGQDWDQLIAKSRKNIQSKILRMLDVDVASVLEEEDFLDPRKIELRTSSSQGALYGNSSNSRFAAFLRHSNFSKRIKGLFFCGGSVHPGGGIPMALSSAKIVDRYFK